MYDIKNIKRKFGSEEEHQKGNSPWNIAADFKVNMSFSKEDIAGMLQEYETDHHTGMDIKEIAGLLFEYTAGYPFLVSRICQIMNEEKERTWTKAVFLEAMKKILTEKNTLFESLVNKLTRYPKLKEVLYTILFQGKEIPYNSLNESIEVAEMLGFIRNEENKVVVANRIFETVLYNLFLSEEVVGNRIYADFLL